MKVVFKKIVFVLLTIVILTAGNQLIIAQESQESQEPQESDVDYAWGTVVSVSETQIVIKEYDYESDAETDVVYTIDPAVELENMSSITELKQGDMVSLSYVYQNGKQVVVSVELDR